MLSTCASLYRLHTSPHQAFQCDAMLQLLPRLSCPGRLLDRFTVRSPVSLLDQGSNTGIEAEMRRIRNKLNKQPISLVHFQNHDLPKSSTYVHITAGFEGGVTVWTRMAVCMPNCRYVQHWSLVVDHRYHRARC